VIRGGETGLRARETRVRDPAGGLDQRFRLLAEGVAVDANGRISLRRYLWRPARTRRMMGSSSEGRP